MKLSKPSHGRTHEQHANDLCGRMLAPTWAHECARAGRGTCQCEPQLWDPPLHKACGGAHTPARMHARPPAPAHACMHIHAGGQACIRACTGPYLDCAGACGHLRWRRLMLVLSSLPSNSSVSFAERSARHGHCEIFCCARQRGQCMPAARMTIMLLSSA